LAAGQAVAATATEATAGRVAIAGSGDRAGRAVRAASAKGSSLFMRQMYLDYIR
jgi:hypothetical protein